VVADDQAEQGLLELDGIVGRVRPGTVVKHGKPFFLCRAPGRVSGAGADLS
jgi:hypothetical protein